MRLEAPTRRVESVHIDAIEAQVCDEREAIGGIDDDGVRVRLRLPDRIRPVSVVPYPRRERAEIAIGRECNGIGIPAAVVGVEDDVS